MSVKVYIESTDPQTLYGAAAIRVSDIWVDTTSAPYVTKRCASIGPIVWNEGIKGSSIEATGLITATGGQIAFPATAVPSADPNTLDDYEEGTWTPALTFATPGDFNVVYGAARLGRYLKWGRSVWLTFVIHASTFIHTTASGALRIAGIPFTTGNIDYIESVGSVGFWGITKANFTNFTPVAGQNLAFLTILASGSGQTFDSVAAADMPTGAVKYLYGTVFYEV